MSATSLAKLYSSTSDVSQASSCDNMSADKKSTKTSGARPPPVRATGSGVAATLKVPKRERHPSGKSEGKTAVKSASSSPKKPAPVTTVKKDKKTVPAKTLPRDSSKKASAPKK